MEAESIVRFDRSKDPSACAAKEAGRYVNNGVAVVREGGKTYLAATDGRALSLVACEWSDARETARSPSYPVAAFAAARKAAKAIKGNDAALSLNGKATVRSVDGSVAEFPPVDERFPDVFCVLPKNAGPHSVTLNASYLATIQKALGCDAVRLEFQAAPRSSGNAIDDTHPVVVRPVYLEEGVVDDGSLAVVMPIASDAQRAKNRKGKGGAR